MQSCMPSISGRILCSRLSPPLRLLPLSSRVRCLHTPSEEGEPSAATEEKFISVDDVLSEVEAWGQDYIFTDSEDSPVWELEDRIVFSGPDEVVSSEMPKVVGALSADALDVTSAYSPEQGFMEMSVKDLQSMSHDVSLILDVRSPEEFQSGHVPTAINMPLPELNRDSIRDSDLENYKDKQVAVICASGGRSAQATVRLSKVLGFNNVVNIKGGTLDWIGQGYPVEK